MERHCGNCRHEDSPLNLNPCNGCHWFSNWAKIKKKE